MKKLLVILFLAVATVATAAEKEVEIKRDFGTIYGTLLTPDKGSDVAALIIAGSGPTDRNGNNPMGMTTNTYRYLAEALDSAGIASLRYDKRAIARSQLSDPSKVAELTLDDYIADAAALADWLAAQGFRKVVLIGHSEGALIALCAAQQSKAVSAVISVAGAGFPMDEILQMQLSKQLLPDNMALYMETNAIVAELKRGKTVDMTGHTPALNALFNPGVQQFLISCFRLDPRQEIRKVAVPVLIVNGDNDLQITPDNADALQKARPEAQKIIIAGMTHPLKKSADRTMQGQMTTVYTNGTLSLDPEFSAAVTGFIRGL